jgi:hypothetical protein
LRDGGGRRSLHGEGNYCRALEPAPPGGILRTTGGFHVPSRTASSGQ